MIQVQCVEAAMSHHVIGAASEQHGSFIQEGEDLCGSLVSLETSHTGGGGHWPHPDLSGYRARAEHGGGGGGGGEGDAAHWVLVATQGLGTQTDRDRQIAITKVPINLFGVLILLFWGVSIKMTLAP